MGGKNSGSLKLVNVDETLQKQGQILDWQASLRQACYDAINDQDIQQIVKNQVAKAKEGDERAIKFIFGTVLGANQPVTIHQTNVITDVATAARLAAKNRGEAS